MCPVILGSVGAERGTSHLENLWLSRDLFRFLFFRLLLGCYRRGLSLDLRLRGGGYALLE